MIPHYRPSFGQEEITAVTEVIRSGQIAQDGKVKTLETIFAQKTGRQFACAVSSGTTALTFALRVLNVGIGDEVVIPSYTCTALWQAVISTGAIPVYADIESETCNLDPQSVQAKITRQTKAIIFPHMFGQPGYIREIIAFGLPVIEDIAQSYGAEIGGQPAGHFGVLAVGSFYATKIIGGGEGGIVLSDSQELIAKVCDLREYDEKDDLRPRLNAKMTDLCAAIAIQQIEKYPQLAARRREIVAIYRQTIGIEFPIPRPNSDLIANNYRCLGCHLSKPAVECIAAAEQMGARFRRPVYRPLHLYRKAESLPNTEKAWHCQFSIPLFPSMSDEDVQLVVKILNRISEL
jgi:dTDP-4-amino-4,6-dideoxygalactose transaminase